ncbi:MAG: cytochrome c4 [Alteromonadaceae bacterium]|nr:cytochrome c4 [Alteromonadaceae bacterium]
MKKVIISLVLGLGLLNGAVAAEGNAEAGKAKSVMCSACHGTDGNSLVPIYPKLAGQSASYIAKQLADFKLGAMSGGKEGRVDAVMGGMVMALSAQDMQDLGAYYSAQSISAGDGSVNSAGEKLHLGGDAERGIAACASCHGKDGEGMKLAGFPSLAGQNSAYLKEQLEEFRSGVRANDKNKIMRDIAFLLKDGDIAALMQHMSSLK